MQPLGPGCYDCLLKSYIRHSAAFDEDVILNFMLAIGRKCKQNDDGHENTNISKKSSKNRSVKTAGGNTKSVLELLTKQKWIDP